MSICDKCMHRIVCLHYDTNTSGPTNCNKFLSKEATEKTIKHTFHLTINTFSDETAKRLFNEFICMKESDNIIMHQFEYWTNLVDKVKTEEGDQE